MLLLVNETTDAVVASVEGLAPSLRCPVHVVEHVFPPECANTGHARRTANPDTMLDDALEPVSLRVRRIKLWRAARLAVQAGTASGAFGAA